MKKLISLLLLLVSISLIFTGCFLDKETSIERVERLTGYNLPDAEELYYFQDETFTGVAGQYSVYNLSKEPECITENKKEDAEKSISSEEITRITETLESWSVPAEYYPDFEKEYSFIIGAEDTYIIYFPEEGQLKIWMWGH